MKMHVGREIVVRSEDLCGLILRKVSISQNCLYHKEKFLDAKRFTQQKSRLQAHTLQFPIITTCNYYNRCVSCVTVSAQDFVERDSVQVWQANVQQDEVRA